MPRFGNRKEIENPLRVTIIVNREVWDKAGKILTENKLTRGQYLRSCLKRLTGDGLEKEIRYVKKNNEIEALAKIDVK